MSKKKVTVIIVSITIIAVIVVTLSLFSKKENSYDTYYEVTKPKELTDYFDYNVSEIDKDAKEYTDSASVNSLIEKLCKENKFTTVEILESWEDNAIGSKNYYILFDSSRLFFCVDKDGTTSASEHNYEEYLESIS